MILCLLVFYWVVTTKMNYDRSCVEKVQSEVDKTEKISQDVRMVANQLSSAESDYNTAIEKARRRLKWVQIVNEVQKLIPDKWWLTSIKALPQKEVKAKAVKKSSMEDDSMFATETGFGGGKRRREATNKDVDLNWIKITGHSLVLKTDELLGEAFEKSVKESKIFANDDDAVSIDSYDIRKGNNNFISFEIQMRLKEPIKK